MAFSVKGFKTITAQNGEDGFAKAESERPDAIIVDLMMPKLNGMLFLAQLKENADLADIPVIVCTALIEEIEKNRAMKLGAEAYYVKTDIDPNMLVNEVKALL
jgi:DNA-binding response OmpR family regulator